MTITERSAHWENVYTKKASTQVSWYQEIPHKSLELIDQFNLRRDAPIIDIGGGDSTLVDHLLKRGYTNLTVMDISSKALQRAKDRLGKLGQKVHWVCADVANFNSEEQFELWHDRAAFHFLNDEHDIENYLQSMSRALPENGKSIISTFSYKGPEACSGIKVRRYSAGVLNSKIKGNFKKIECLEDMHVTPRGKQQHFIYCSFVKLPLHGTK